jgi:hypothetical protein
MEPSFGESAPKTIRLRDLLSREPRLCRLYQEVAQAEPNAYLGTIIDAGNKLIVCVASDPVVGIVSEQRVKSMFLVPSGIDIVRRPHDLIYPIASYCYRLPHGSGGVYSSACPIAESGHLIVPWPNAGYLSPLLRCFLEAYILGMLARYFPSRWMALIRNQKGDAALPLLRRTIKHVEDDFPELVLSQLRAIEN